MALVSRVLRTCGILFVFILQVSATDNLSVEPWIVSLNVVAKSCLDVRCKYLLLVNGSDYLGHNSWRLTSTKGSRGSYCDTLYPNYELREIETSQRFTKVQVLVPNVDEKIYFCLRHSKQKNTPIHGTWVHQGGDLFLHPRNDQNEMRKNKNESLEPNEYQEAQNLNDLQKPNSNWVDLSHDIDVNYLPNMPTPTREEAEDLEVLINNKYVPLNKIKAGFKNINEINNGIEKINDRRKRDIIKDLNFEIKRMNDGKIQERLPEMFQNDQNYHNVVNPQISDISVVRSDGEINVEGLRIEDSDKEPKIIENGIPSVLAETKVILRLFGQGLSPRTVIAFTHDPMPYGQPCKFLLKGEYIAKEGSVTKTSALFDITAPSPLIDSKLYICAKTLKLGISDPFEDEEKYLHQGTEHWKMIATHTKLLPLWVTLALILFCLMFSALFSGLNLGLMSLDRTELKIIANTGTEEERNYARAIMPVRDHGNYLLCSILLGNVAVNSTFTILLDDLTSGLFAVIFSTLSIVLLGEITPQAICSRHGLMIGAKSIMITKVVMALTAPLAFPVSKLLDYFLGEEIGSVYNRERLKELVKVTTDVNDLDKDEVNIISGALELRKKKVSDVMTKLEDVFMLPITSVLDFETMSEIIKSGYSRIPVYEGSRVNIVTVLFIKDLAFVDPDDNTPLRTLCQYYQNPCNFVFEDVTLDVMFRQFKEGHKGHMAFVHRINSEGEGDPFYETVGLVTLEDVIEEMIQAEIVDETDVFTDNRSKRRRNRPQNKLQDFAAFAERHENQRIHISPQLTLATFQFLSTSVDAFKPDAVSETVLRRLLKQDVIFYIKMKGKSKREASTYVYQQGKAVDYFVLILEGRVEVTVGRENLVFEAGPFTYFGVQALTQNVGVAESPTPSAMGSLQNINMEAMLRHSFVPDYSVRAVADLHYLAVKRSLYLAAKRATLMEKGALSKGATNEQFDTEVDKRLSGLSNAQITHPTEVKPSSSADQRMESVPGTRSRSNESQAGPSAPPPDWNPHWSRELASDRTSPARSPSNTSTRSESEIKKGKKNFYAKTYKMMNLNQNDDKYDNVPTSSRTLQNRLRIRSDASLRSLQALEPASSALSGALSGALAPDARREASKKAQFKTQNSLLTFHEHADSQGEEASGNTGTGGPGTDRQPDSGELKMVYKNELKDNIEKLLQSVDEDISISGEHKTPSRQVSPHPPVSASPATRASFSRVSPERNGDVFGRDEQEKLLKH